MSNPDLATALKRVAERLLALTTEDPPLRDSLRAAAKTFLEATEPPKPVITVAPPAPPPPPPLKPVVPLAPIILGPRQVPADPIESLVARFGESSDETSDDDLPLVESRCRIKGEGARWAATRRRLMAEGADHHAQIQPTDRDLIDRAKKLPDCYLWLNRPDGPQPEDLSQLGTIAGCFDACAQAVALVRELLAAADRPEGDFVEALRLLAEAQSALRAAVLALHARQDKDQLRLYQWLYGATKRHNIYIDRYMRIDDTADPAAWEDLAARIEGVAKRVHATRNKGKAWSSSIKKVRYHLRPILDNGDTADHARDWRIVMDTVHDLVAQGTPPSNPELREILAPVVDRVPEGETPEGFTRVLREIDRYLSTRLEANEDEQDTRPSAEVRAAASLLAGKVAVFIGGSRRPKAHEALRKALNLAELDWIETREHESTAYFEHHVARPDVAVVLLAIRWSSHSFGDVKQFCERHGKPLVRLPGGYNPNQVAVQVLNQCGQRLRV